MRRLLGIALAGILSLSCQGGVRARRDATPVPTPVVILPKPVEVSYRVTGTIRNAHITYFSSVQGTTQVITDLPWFLGYTTPRDNSVFVYLSAEAPFDNILDGSLQVQIFIDGQLFREARSSGSTPSVAVSGEVTQ